MLQNNNSERPNASSARYKSKVYKVSQLAKVILPREARLFLIQK
jgi:hypothetical protein